MEGRIRNSNEPTAAAFSRSLRKDQITESARIFASAIFAREGTAGGDFLKAQSCHVDGSSAVARLILFPRFLESLYLITSVYIASNAGKYGAAMKNHLNSPVLVVGFITGACVFAPTLRAAAAAPIPYTVTLREIGYRAGVVIDEPQTEYTIAMRSDGSRSYAHALIPPRPGSRRGRTINLSSGQEILVDEAQSLRSTFEKEFDWKTIALDPANNCLTNMAGRQLGGQPRRMVGPESIHGYRAVRIEDVGSGITYWFALDYGCAMVQLRATFDKDLVSEQQLIKLTPGEPDATWFTIPGTYAETVPSKLLCSGGQCASAAKLLHNLDEAYNRQRAERH